jgi:formate hydrogenlyase transcriptional activator
VRIIAATNRHLQKEVREGRFRSDLYYRLNVFPISIPPLRNRPEDIMLLAGHFVNKYAALTGKKINHIAASAGRCLLNYSWPGNVRELEHLIERSILLSQGNDNVLREIPLPDASEYTASHTMEQKDAPVKTIYEMERDHILTTIKKCAGKISGKGGAAALLGVPASTLNSKISKLGIAKRDKFS